MIDGIYGFIIVLITIFLALIAAIIIPNRSSVLKGDISKYSSARSSAAYAIGALVVLLTIIYLIYVNNNFDTLHWLAIFNGIFLSVIGIGIIAINYSTIKALKERSMDGMGVPGTTTPAGAVPVDDFTGASQTISRQAAPTQQSTARQIPATTSDGISIQVRKPLSGAGTAQVPKKDMKVGCPKCNGVIKIDTSQPVTTIRCPYCGFEGSVG